MTKSKKGVKAHTVESKRDNELNISSNGKKNYWRKLYKKEEYKEGVIDKMCAEFASEVYEKAQIVSAQQLRRHIKDWNLKAESVANMDIEFSEGWKLHKDWFKCMIAQLYVAGCTEQNTGFHHRIEAVKALFEDLGWNFNNSRFPKYDNLTTIYEVEYRYKNGGVDESRFYKIILEPTSIFPDGALYESGSGRQWRVIDANGKCVKLKAEEAGVNGKYQIIELLPQIVHAMKRVA